MKKILLLTPLIIYLFSFTIFAETTKDDYTIMIYMNGSTLESNYNYSKKSFQGIATKDLEEMIAGYKEGDNINVIVETIGTKRWNNKFVNSEETERFLLTENGFDLQYTLPKQNVGYKKSLSDFIIWTKRNYPAKKYGLIMWNHGGGPVKGFGFDENFNGDRLHLEELDSALKKSKETADIHFEFIGFDACIMSSVEIAHILSPYSNYLLASEDLEPSHGWNYTTLLKELHIDPTMTGATLGKIVGKCYLEDATEKSSLYNITFSVIDLSKVKAIINELELLVQSLEIIFDTPKSFYDFAKVAGKSQNLGIHSQVPEFTDLIDLVDFAQNLSKEFDISTENLIKAVDEAVIYNLDTSHNQKTNGLSIYFPLKNKKNMKKSMGYYEKTNFNKTYIDFIIKFQNQIAAFNGEKQIEFTTNTPNDESDFYHIKFDQEDEDKIAHVYLSVYTSIEDDKLSAYSLKSLGYNTDISYDTSHKFYNELFDKDWIFLDDQPLGVWIIADTEDVIKYESPILYNDKPMYLLFSFEKETESYTLHGIKSDRDPKTGKVDRNIYNLNLNDSIVPVYRAFHSKRKHFEWIKGEKLKVNENTQISRKKLNADSFFFSFKFYDYSYKHYQTDVFQFKR